MTLADTRSDADRLFDLLGLPPIAPIPMVTTPVFQTRANHAAKEPVVPCSDDDRLAREAVAKIEREDGHFGCAEHRLRGAYDGDSEHRIALEAIRLARLSTHTDGGKA